MISGLYDPPREEGEFCVIYDMGKFDLVVFQSDDEAFLELNLKVVQSMFDKDLKMVHYNKVRHLEWKIDEIYLPEVK